MSPLSAVFIVTVGLLIALTLAGMGAAWVWALGQYRNSRILLPEPKSRHVPWRLGSVVLVVVAWLAVPNAIVLTYAAAAGRIASPGRVVTTSRSVPKLSITEQMLLLSVSNATLLVLIPTLLRATAGARLADLGFGTKGLGRHIRHGVMGFLLIAPAVYLLNGIAVVMWSLVAGKPEPHPLQKMIRDEFSLGVIELIILSAVVFAPAAEELIFRGVIQGWLSSILRRKEEPLVAIAHDDDLGVMDTAEVPHSESPETRRWWVPSLPRPSGRRPVRSNGSRSLPILLTSFFFASAHLPQWPAPMAIFFLSIGLGLVYERTGNLVSSFTMHALFNGLSTLFLFVTLIVDDGQEKKAAKPVVGGVILPQSVLIWQQNVPWVKVDLEDL